MIIKLGKNYWVEIYTAKQYDKLYGAETVADNIKLLCCTVRIDTETGQEMFSDMGLLYGNNKLGIISRGTVRNCTLTEFLGSLRYTWN